MGYIKLYENFETNNLDKFKELAGITFRILNCDKIKIENGYKIEWVGFHVANIIIDNDSVYLDLENSKKEYELTHKGVASLLAKLTTSLSEIRNKKGLLNKKSDIIKDLKNVNIPDEEINSKLGQNDVSTIINFIEKGEPSEYYLRKVKDLITKYQ